MVIFLVPIMCFLIVVQHALYTRNEQVFISHNVCLMYMYMYVYLHLTDVDSASFFQDFLRARWILLFFISKNKPI